MVEGAPITVMMRTTPLQERWLFPGRSPASQ